MSFFYPKGGSGVFVGGRDLMEFSAKLQTGYTMGSSALETETLQSLDRGSQVLLSQRFGPTEIVLPLEFWGQDRQDTVWKWTDFCRTVSGEVEVDLGDGFQYACTVTDLGEPVWLSDSWLSADVTLRGFRHLPRVTLSPEELGEGRVLCQGTFPRTGCVITVPGDRLQGANLVEVRLAGRSWRLEGPFSGDLTLDGERLAFTLGGAPVADKLTWDAFPYLEPGENRLQVFLDGTETAGAAGLSYRPAFL